MVSARYTILRDEPISVTTMTRKQIVELPHFGDDLYRAVKILPGTSGGDITSRFSVRGSLDREVLAEEQVGRTGTHAACAIPRRADHELVGAIAVAIVRSWHAALVGRSAGAG